METGDWGKGKRQKQKDVKEQSGGEKGRKWSGSRVGGSGVKEVGFALVPRNEAT